MTSAPAEHKWRMIGLERERLVIGFERRHIDQRAYARDAEPRVAGDTEREGSDLNRPCHKRGTLSNLCRGFLHPFDRCLSRSQLGQLNRMDSWSAMPGENIRGYLLD